MTRTTLEDTGERMIPAAHDRTIMYAEHMTRYIAAQKIAANKVVLDIASGTGYGTKLLSEVADKVYGVDVSAEAIEYAKENYSADNIEYILGDAETIPLPDNSVDLVVTFETIEHITDYKAFIKEIKRVLKEDGLAIVSTPNDEEFAEGNHFHLHEFTLKELKSLLSKSFSNLKSYQQATWAYVQISEDEYINTKDAITNVEVHNFAPLKPEKYLYFYMLCSNRKIDETIADIGGLGGHYSARELGDIFAHYQKQISDHKVVYANEQEAHRKTKIKLKMREGENHAITQSTSYKVARVLASSKQGAKVVVGHIKALNPKQKLMLRRNRRNIKGDYASEQFTSAFSAPATAKLAVIIHLFYVDMLPFFVEKLKNIDSLKYDLYITVPQDKENAKAKVLEALPSARVAVVPNCGRDVLPFVQVMQHIKNHGYNRVLKLHSKKSPHREDGEQWRDKIVESLLPANPAVLADIGKTLNRADTALIGPDGEYVSMLVNLSSTAHYIKELTEKVVGKSAAKVLLRHPDEYGFFGGTMFWARTDAILPLVNAIKPERFEPEFGQEDSTLAHALERLLNVIPELEGKQLYEVQPEGVSKISYTTTNIPKWSEIAIDD